MQARNRNELWARVLLDELARCGVEVLTVSPGSRSSPLVLAAASDSRFRLSVQIDERSAGFFALGCGKATGVPAGVITTSGTAVANLLPAVVEASQSETPLLVISADRPPHLRGADANQAIDQTHLFGRYTRAFHELSPERVTDATLRHLRSTACRAVADAMGDPAGPVHLNLPFAKPLEPVRVAGDVPVDLEEDAPLAWNGRPEGAPFTRIHPRRLALDAPALDGLTAALSHSEAPLLVAGPVSRPWEVGPLLRELARRTGIPLLADPLSGARFGAGGTPDGEPSASVLGGYDLFLRSPEVRKALRPDLILRVGGTPTSSALHTFLEEVEGGRQLVLDGGARWKDHLALVDSYLSADPARTLEEVLIRLGEGEPRETVWAERWIQLEAALGQWSHTLPTGAPFEGGMVGMAAGLAPRDGLLFISSSMPVRDFDAFALPRGENGAGPLVLGNRGASGIDGIVSTAAGASFATGKRVLAIVGDLALLHDQNGLASLRDPAVRVTLVVVNNDGGGIFHLLPIRDYEPEFTRFFATPHGRAPERVAAVQDLPFFRVDPYGLEEWGEALPGTLLQALELKGSSVVELVSDRERNRERRSGAIGEALAVVLATLDL